MKIEKFKKGASNLVAVVILVAVAGAVALFVMSSKTKQVEKLNSAVQDQITTITV